MSKLVLASGSPRRRELLTQVGFRFTVHPAHIPEDPQPGEEPIAYVTRLAREKAEAVYRQLAGSRGQRSEIRDQESGTRDQGLGTRDQEPATPGLGTKGLGTEALETRDQKPEAGPAHQDGLVVLGADTTVTLDGHILGKPEDAADAARILRLLSGRTHRVITGVAVVSPRQDAAEPLVEVAAEVTAVRFLTLSEEEIAAYIAGGEPMDKAGAYGIQGQAARWIPRIEGDYFNVVGLPLALVATLLESAGIRPKI